MSNNLAVLQHDLMVLDEMADSMAAYLTANSIDWTLPRPNLPKLSIGGYLMREERLEALKNKLPADDQLCLQSAKSVFNASLVENIVLFEMRTHQELHARIGEWSVYLRSLSRHAKNAPKQYAGMVDTRIVITSMMKKMNSTPYQLDEQIPREIQSFDRMLRNCWEADDFVWDEIWRDAYPEDEYWYLYGHPRVGC